MLEDPFEFTASNCDRPPSRSTSAQRAGGVSGTSVPSGHESRSVAWRFVATAKCYRPAQADTTAPSFGRRDQGSWTSVGGAATVESESSFLQVVCALLHICGQEVPAFFRHAHNAASAANAVCFVVNGRYEADVQKPLTPGFLRSVVSSPASEKLIIEAAAPWLVVYRRGRRIPPEQWESFLHEAGAIASTFALDSGGNQTRNVCSFPAAV